MKAWLLNKLEGLGELHLADVADPVPGRGDVVLDVELAALNPADRYLTQGEYPTRATMPHILGRDGVGVISAVGSNVPDLKIGQRMLILRGDTGVHRWGSFAQKVAVATESLTALPAGWTLEESAAAPLVYLTAYQALTQFGDLPPSVVLITGASGGVGVASVQLAKALGHTTIALSRSAEKQKKLLNIGADLALDPASANWRKDVREFLGARRVDLIIDNIGGPLLPDAMETLGANGRISIVGRLAGPVPQFNTASMIFRRLRMGGVAVGAYTPSESQKTWKVVLGLIERTGARPLIDHVFPFKELLPAFERLAAGPMGKVLLDVRKIN
ncbi:MAG: zinc-binding alcohol dehydrogenase family protein [Planctomycetota bacterium]|nr:zinc-binding alcohol dehydrogenase family protein [Planctomycetota bacterium]